MFNMPNGELIHTDVVVIGAGIAGINVAKIIKEFTEKEVWLLGSPYESQVAKAGYIVDSDDVSSQKVGQQLIKEMFEETKGLGIKTKTSLVTEIEPQGEKVLSKTKFQDFISDYIIIATGAKQMNSLIPGFDDLLHQGVSDCAVCDANLYKNKKVALFGNHEYSLQSLKFLLNVVPDVYLLWEGENLSTTELPLDKSKIYLGVKNLRIFGNEVVEEVKFESNKEQHSLKINGLFVESKPRSNSTIFQNLLEVTENGEIVTDQYFRTSAKNIYAIGDVTSKEKSVASVFNQLKSFKNLVKSKTIL